MPNFKTCDTCGIDRPETQFRWRRVGVTRHSDCNVCHLESEKARQRRVRQERRDRKLSRGCSAIAQADDLHDVIRLSRILLQGFNGSRGLANRFSTLVNASPPASPFVAHAIVSILKLQAVAELLAPEPQLPATLEAKRAALAREFSAFLLEQLHERPQEFADLLAAAGWTCQPPQARDRLECA